MLWLRFTGLMWNFGQRSTVNGCTVIVINLGTHKNIQVYLLASLEFTIMNFLLPRSFIMERTPCFDPSSGIRMPYLLYGCPQKFNYSWTIQKNHWRHRFVSFLRPLSCVILKKNWNQPIPANYFASTIDGWLTLSLWPDVGGGGGTTPGDPSSDLRIHRPTGNFSTGQHSLSAEQSDCEWQVVKVYATSPCL